MAAGFDLPSVYLLTGERLRCRAARGYFQVVDGFPTGVGVIGRVVATGRGEFISDVTTRPDFIAAVPGLRSEACVPVVVDGAAVGAVNVESRSELAVDAMSVLEAAAGVLGARLSELGGLPVPSLAHRLGQTAIAMTQASGAADISRLSIRSAVDLSGIASAAIVDLTGRTAAVSAATGPLAERLLAWGPQELATMATWVSAGTSSYFPGGEDVPAGYAFLQRARVRAVSVHPLVSTGRLSGLLVLAGEDPVPFSGVVVESLELLAAQTAACLGVAAAVSELTRRVDLDGLTGLRNVSAFARELDERASDARGALMLIDIDDFKAVNDSYGHLAGDRLLQALADELRAVLREGDLLYRIGGDEFAALVTVDAAGELEQLATRLLGAARRVRTTASVGTARLRAGNARARADAALYAAKGAGKDAARHADPS